MDKLVVIKLEMVDMVDLGWCYYSGVIGVSVDVYVVNLKNKMVNGYDNVSG